MKIGEIFVGNDFHAMLRGLYDRSVEGAERYINDGVAVTMRLQHGNLDVPGDGIVWPISLANVVGSNGDWQGVIPGTVEVVADRVYRLLYIVSGTHNARFVRPLQAKIRNPED